MNLDDEMMASLGGIEYQPMMNHQAGANSSMMGVGRGSGVKRELDLVFILDCTGFRAKAMTFLEANQPRNRSDGAHMTTQLSSLLYSDLVQSATKNIELIVENILDSGKLPNPDALRIGLIAYRDYPPQDNSYITRSFDFTSDVASVKADLKTLNASGGGDGPEGVTAAMKASLGLSWRLGGGTSRMAVLIADAPCHGLGEYGDGFPDGGPDGEDPLEIARLMAQQAISLFVVACEPALSGYQFGLDLFRALTVITSAVLVPLTTASLLSHVIVGSALEQMDMERIIEEVGLVVAERVHEGQASVDDIALELHRKLLLRGEETKQLKFESIHRDSPEAQHNVQVLTTSPSLQQAKAHLKKIVGSRFTKKYLETRYNRTSYVYPPSVPPRPTSTSGIGSGIGSAPPGSPQRKVISEFKPFVAKGRMTLQEAPMAERLDDQEGVEEEGDAGGIELRFGNISLDQAKRITIASAWRTQPPRA
ncbi:BQ2448_7844 [Microbotryum intermedium]|uniref:BQ2448_7844 protein n=1 Tax=Microbotryum intermedium TaxID=269621 RepID=A0A238FNQ9_9BASI|nr:BQ2448_7844 [Microbotryum intermedium]